MIAHEIENDCLFSPIFLMKQFQLLCKDLTIDLPAQKTIWFFFGWLVRENFIWILALVCE